ncbi:hypothetical protein HK104_001075, partial [Borealophlyctis nickersoniae]
MFAAVRKKDVGTLRAMLSVAEAHPGSTPTGTGVGGNLGNAVDPNEVFEGTTPLQLAAAMGNTEMVELLLACKKVNVNLQDSESGYTALHKVLGHPEDRAFPERVNIPEFHQDDNADSQTFASFTNQQSLIQSVTLSKYHTCILTKGQIYTHGFGPGGRLGLGHEETTLYPTMVRGIEGSVSSVALGPDHTVALTGDGRVWTWGSNRHGQLGYSTELVGTEPGPALQPRELKNLQKRLLFIGAAASKYHTAICSEDTVYTFGTNLGQLGYHQPMDTLQQNPKKVTNFPQQGIVAVAATNVATAILTATHNVFVFAEFQCSRITFPYSQLPRDITFCRQVSRKGTSVVKVVSGNHQFAALTQDGDVFLWSPPEKRFADSWQQKTSPQTRPIRVWSVRKKHLAARDVAIGIDSSLVIRTESGHVFLGLRRKDMKVKSNTHGDWKETVYFKYHKIPYLQHIVTVSASISGAYAAIRSDTRPYQILLDPSTLRVDLQKAFAGIGGNGPESELRDTFHDDRFVDVTFHLAGDQIQHAHRVVLTCRSPFFRRLVSDLESEEGEATRNFKDAVIRRTQSDQSDGFIYDISMPQFHRETLLLVLDWIYTGTFVKPWNDASAVTWGKKLPKIATSDPLHPSAIYAEFHHLVKLFELGDPDDVTRAGSNRTLMKSTAGDVKYRRNIQSILTHPETYDPLADVLIRLEDRDVPCHQVILVSRCPFFEAMLGSGSRWMLRSDDAGRVVVGMDHITWPVFRLILRYIYGGDDGVDSVFADIAISSVEKLVQFVVEVMSCANELLMERVKDICSVVLISVLDLRNVVGILEVADMYGADKLKDACLNFVCHNLETTLECKMLDDVSSELVTDVETYLKTKQSAKFPATRGPDGIYHRIRSMAAKEEEDKKQRRRIAYRQRQEEAARLSASMESFSSSLGTSLGKNPRRDLSDEMGADESEPGGEGDSEEDQQRPRDGDENVMFELEMEESKHQATAGGRKSVDGGDGRKRKGWKKSWTKLELTSSLGPPVVDVTTSDEGVKPAASSPSNRESLGDGQLPNEPRIPSPAWGAAKRQTSQPSLRDIMTEAQSKTSSDAARGKHRYSQSPSARGDAFQQHFTSPLSKSPNPQTSKPM